MTSNSLTVSVHKKKPKNKIKEDIALLHLIKINGQNARVIIHSISHDVKRLQMRLTPRWKENLKAHLMENELRLFEVSFVIEIRF